MVVMQRHFRYNAECSVKYQSRDPVANPYVYYLWSQSVVSSPVHFRPPLKMAAGSGLERDYIRSLRVRRRNPNEFRYEHGTRASDLRNSLWRLLNKPSVS